MLPRSLRSILAGLATASIVHALWLASSFGGPGTTRLFDNLMMGAAAALAGSIAVSRARHLSGRPRTAWMLLGFASLSWAVGQLVWTTYEHALEELAPYPSWADAGYFGFIPLALGGVILLRRQGTTRYETARDLLDAITASFALLYVIWPKVLAPLYADTASPPAAKALSLAYPIGELIVLTAVLLLAPRLDDRNRRPILILGLGLLFLTMAHLVYAGLIVDGLYYTGHPIDVGWFSGFLLLGAAALLVQPDAVPSIAAPRGFGFISLAPYAPVLLMLAATVVFEVDTSAQDPVMEISAGIVILAILARQALSIFENRQLSQRLSISLAEVQNADAQRKQLLNNIAHDLNGPLTPIRIQAHLIQSRDPPLPPDVLSGAAAMQRSVDQLERLVSDVADLARLDVGRLRMDRRPIDLAELVGNAGKSFAAVASARHVRLHVEAKDQLLVMGDATRLNQVVNNLLGNALKFTPAEGNIILTAHGTGTECVVGVRDSGPGLTVAQMARLFQPFSQVHDPQITKVPGSGLGLFISRGIIEAHGGRLWVESEGADKGSTFEFSLPRN